MEPASAHSLLWQHLKSNCLLLGRAQILQVASVTTSSGIESSQLHSYMSPFCLLEAVDYLIRGEVQKRDICRFANPPIASPVPSWK
jgi:hypothetical protein